MTKKTVSFILLIFYFISIFKTDIFASVPVSDEDYMAYILMEPVTGRVLLENNSKKKMYPASLTKILTAIVALEHESNLMREMTASQWAVDAIGKDGSNIGILPGEVLLFRDLLHSVIIRSANEAANIIAESISGSEAEFVKLMNEKAVELGAMDSHFNNPCGKHEDNHYTTAYDMALIMRYAMNVPQIMEITPIKFYEMPVTNKHTTENWAYVNATNKLLLDETLPYKITGMKTGFTNPAGLCVAASSENNEGMQLLSVVMNSQMNDNQFNFTKKLMNYGFDNYKYVTVINNMSVMTSTFVENAFSDPTLNLLAKNDFKVLFKSDDDMSLLKKEIIMPDKISAPIIENEYIGQIKISYDDVELGTVDLIAAKNIKAYEPAPTLNSFAAGNNDSQITIATTAPKENGIDSFNPEAVAEGKDTKLKSIIFFIVIGMISAFIIFYFVYTAIQYNKYKKKMYKKRRNLNRSR